MESTDLELLTRFANKQCEPSFRQLVNRHLGMVFSVAMRVTGERGLAEEIAQTAFATLAEKRSDDIQGIVVAGWLYHTARNLALAAVRSEQRRRQREQIAVTMNTDKPDPDVVAEHLESAMDQLKPDDRDALVLRFFEDRNLRDVGRELGLSEDAARMRINRSLEKLRKIFGKLGITGTTTWLTTALPASASAAVPSGLGTSVTAAILSGGAVTAAAATIATKTASNTMNTLMNLKTATAVVAAATIAGISTYVVKDKQVDELRADFRSLNEAHAQLVEEREHAIETIQFRERRIASLEKDVVDIHRLRGEVDSLNRNMAQLDQLKSDNEKLTTYFEERNADGVTNLELLIAFASGTAQTREVMATLQYSSALAEALATVADENGGMYPDSVDAAHPIMGTSFYGGVRVMGILLRADDFEIVYEGKLSEIEDPANTLLFRQIGGTIGPDRTVKRVCYYADRRAEVVSESRLPNGTIEVHSPSRENVYE